MSDEKKTAVINKLNESRAALEALAASLGEAGWETAVYSSENEEPWLVRDMLVHLVDSKKGMAAMAANWRKGRDPIPRDFDLHRWNNGNIKKSKERTVPMLLAENEANHVRLLGLVEKLAPEDWAKTGWHSMGAEMSVEQVLNLIAKHEAEHVAEIESALR